MIDILMQLADIGSTVTIVVTKKDDNYLISITPKTLSHKLQPVLISGSKEDIMADLPKILEGMGEMKQNITNLESINKKLDEKLKEKVVPAKTESGKSETKSAKKGPLKVGSGNAKAEPANDLFGSTQQPVTEKADDLDEAEETEDVVEQPETTTEIVEAKETAVSDIPESNEPVEEEEEIF